MTTLNRAVAVAMVQGPEQGLAVVAALEADKRIARHHRLLAVRAHLRELTGDREAAAADYRAAAKLTDSAPEQRHLISRAKIASDLENVASDSENVASDVEIPESAPTPSRKDTIPPTTTQE